MSQPEAAIDYARGQDRVLREHFPQVARSHREEVLPPEIGAIYEPRQLGPDEAEDETETARALSEREKREHFRQHRNLEHAQSTELARAVRHTIANPTTSRHVASLFAIKPVWDGTSAKALDVVCWCPGLEIARHCGMGTQQMP